MHFFCSFQALICWWTPPSMPWVTVLSCCCSRWVKMTRTASSSATSCTVAMATVLGPWGRMCESTVVRSAVQCGTHRVLMENSGIRLSWLSAPSGLISTRYKLCHSQLEVAYSYMWWCIRCFLSTLWARGDLISWCVNETRCQKVKHSKRLHICDEDPQTPLNDHVQLKNTTQ